MNTLFLVLTIVFIVISTAMILIILVQRPQGGGLAAAFGGAGGGGTDTVFGGRVGDALTWATVGAFGVYLVLAIVLNKVDSAPPEAPPVTPASISAPAGTEPLDSGLGTTPPPADPTGGLGLGDSPNPTEPGDTPE